MFKYFTTYSTRKYNDMLDTLVERHYNTVHSSIKMTQVEASFKVNENKVWRNAYSDFGGDTLTPQFLFGDNLIIMTKKHI